MKENQEQPNTSPVIPSTQAPVLPPKNWPKIPLFILLELIVIATSVFIGIQIGRNQIINQQTAANPITSSATPNSTTNPTSDWKIYNSPEIDDYVSPFQLSYPPAWTIEQKLNSEEPKSLTLTLTNSNNETIKILQGMGGGGACVYYDDADYASYEGAGQFFSSYNQLYKPALWRISQFKDKSETSHVVCEKTNDRYIDGTRIGWISVNIKSETSMQEVKLILENIVFKPTSKTKTLFD